MKKKGLLIDAALGLVLTGVVALNFWSPPDFSLLGSQLLSGLEFKTYDLRSSLRQALNTPDEIVLVAIDDDSITQIGRWPWPRSRFAAALDKIAQQHPRVIGLDIVYSEAETDPGSAEIARLKSEFDELVAAKKIAPKRGVDFDAEFSSAALVLDSDARLESSIKSAGNVILPLYFVDNPAGEKPVALGPEIEGSGIRATVPPNSVPVGGKAIVPIRGYAAAAAGLSQVDLYPESDGVVRREAPVVEYNGLLYPSFALRLVMSYFGVKPSDMKFKPGIEVSGGRVRVPVDAEGKMPITFLGPAGAKTIKHVSFQQVFGSTLSPDYFKDKIVIVGPTASGVGNEHGTPLSPSMADIEISAHAAENMLHSHFLVSPDWAPKVEWGMIAAIGIFLMLILPRLRAFWGLIASLLLGLAVMGAGTYYFFIGQWIKIAYPLVLLLVGYVVIVSRQFLLTEKGKELVEASAIETNKMLGLSFQGQGMLDLAFEKFRLCPLDDPMKELLYNLALDFERKRMYSKAAAVLEHVVAKDAGYKDAKNKIATLKAASEGAVFGSVGGRKDATALLTSAGGAKPTLGRYEIEKELGRGAMGVVYLGRDPKINRQVAIKTMMLEEAEGGGSKEVKERFFREAESAGTLNHPNIVRIFDAGEENDVAYIAMELLDGHDLTRYGQKENLLPVDKVLDYVATVADALDYAHRQGIVHRDIKPANVMLLKDGSIRVADFGIARITASSKTASGTVMGTPSYMSPEQVAGRKVDGRSDLFSLTVALYELLTGEKPFKGGDGIGTLLFQIANDPHPDLRAVRPDLPPALKAIIDKGLAKNPAQRYQRGADLATALRSVFAESKAGSLESVLPSAPLEERVAPTYVPPPERTEERTAPVPAVPVAGYEPEPEVPAEPEAPVLSDEVIPEPQSDRTVTMSAEEAAFDANPAAEPEPQPEAAYAADETAAEDTAESTLTSDKTITMPVPAAPSPEDTFVAEPVEPAEGGMRIELGARAGIRGSEEPPPPPPPAEDSTVSFNPDATIAMPPREGA